MGTVIQFLKRVATQARSGWTDIVPREDKNSAEELQFELLKGLV